ncbi:MAG: DMT family transporter [Solirubrobacteraceae bacterium]|jgi:drug/metabolite transporter (DMT)-like permease
MTLGLGVAAAVASAVATNVGFLLRHRGAVAAPDVDPRHLLRSAVGLFRSKWWTIGYLVAAIAYALHVGALALAPLSLVQAVLAGGLVLLAVIAERFFGFHLGKREWIGVTLAALGLGFIAVTGNGPPGQASAHYSPPAMIAFECLLVGVGASLILSGRIGRFHRRRGVLLGASAGLLFTVAHVAVKALTAKADVALVEVLTSPLLGVAFLAWVVAFFASARSLQVGEAVAVIAITSIAGNASAIPAGIVVFGDPIGSDGPSVIARVLAFTMVVLAAGLIPGPIRAGSPSREPTSGALSSA